MRGVHSLSPLKAKDWNSLPLSIGGDLFINVGKYTIGIGKRDAADPPRAFPRLGPEYRSVNFVLAPRGSDVVAYLRAQQGPPAGWDIKPWDLERFTIKRAAAYFAKLREAHASGAADVNLDVFPIEGETYAGPVATVLNLKALEHKLAGAEVRS